MGDFFSKIDALKESLSRVSTTIRRVRVLKQEAVQATSPEQEKRRVRFTQAKLFYTFLLPKRSCSLVSLISRNFFVR